MQLFKQKKGSSTLYIDYSEDDVWYESRTELDDRKVLYLTVCVLVFIAIVGSLVLTLITFRQEVPVTVTGFRWQYLAIEQWWQSGYRAACKCNRYQWDNKFHWWTQGDGREPYFWTPAEPFDPNVKRTVIGAQNHLVDAVSIYGVALTANLSDINYWRTLGIEQRLFYYLDIRGEVVGTSEEPSGEYMNFMGRHVNFKSFMSWLLAAAFAVYLFGKIILFRTEAYATVTGHSWKYSVTEQHYKSKYSPAHKRNVTQWWDERGWYQTGDDIYPSYPNRIAGNNVRYVKNGTDHLLHCALIDSGRVLKPDIYDYPEGDVPPLWQQAREGDTVILELGWLNNVNRVKLLRRDANVKRKRSWP